MSLARGVEIRTEGDSFFVVFEAPGAAVRAVVDAQRGLDRYRWPRDKRCETHGRAHRRRDSEAVTISGST